MKLQKLSQLGITNLRDIGGYATTDGHLKTGIFFRSGELYDLTSSTTTALNKQLTVKKIFDFRRPAEINNRPDTPIPSAEYENINLLATPAQANPSLKNMVINPQMDSYMFTVYEELALSKSARNGYQLFLNEILALKKPLIFHCFAGKDRTGFAAALLLKLAGVNDDDIFDDYLATNQARQKANQKILAEFAEKLSAANLAALKVSLNVRAEYLQHAFAEISQHYGSFDNYLTAGLQLAPDYITKFRHQFIE
ncbi:tyrosine-protein phosphatase [Liquorilactobacillus nagelii]|uniref:tyrosine-protein phosphatase n=1 Tax=Liquorilactobacillus nagelii TaxID=82688 RepID=UPI0006EF6812|nr:tyrosine-protein phosphatase [Liquorilactobacillus nagelii]KRL40202.1 protein tyrosine serine phosphatase [Liquorilactobacillus nagelii DSM 13675]QYH54897.1 tyrosine-protein phosphatase [Liquorilactobacillus nagelii DSM 13675]